MAKLSHKLRHQLFHLAARWSLRRFQRRTKAAGSANVEALTRILRANSTTVFGQAHRFRELGNTSELTRAFAASVALCTYHDLEPYVARIARGEHNVLTADPVHMLAGSSGTTGTPKRIPRTHRAQRHHMALVVLAEQAVIDQGIPGAREHRRGINLMSVYAPPATDGSAVPVMAGPNAGMARLRRQIPVLWCSPVPVYEVAHPAAALYLHALFALRESEVLYIETPFAPQLAGWFALIERQKDALIADLRHGTLNAELPLTAVERHALQLHLHAEPNRAAAVAEALRPGLAGVVPRLWPGLRYLRTVTSGSFNLSLPRLRWLAGPTLPIHSGCHSSSEGVIGINLKTDGSTDYVLAVGTAYFEFIPLDRLDEAQAPTVQLPDLQVGAEYEIVLTSSAGLYRYRLGDVIRIRGWYGTAPTFQYLYRRGTLLNLVGEKTSELHTATAVSQAFSRWLGTADPVRDYTVAGDLSDGIGRYTFYVELADQAVPRLDLQVPARWLDEALAETNPYYRSSGRLPERLAAPILKLVRSGTFEALLAHQRERALPATATQVKVPRQVTTPGQLALLNSNVVAEDKASARYHSASSDTRAGS
ncbi:MAG: GH3 auxin-responsive promoter family protein [Bryobacteraceae bacterium]|nr:GH3 auxin-responsive promoter family protein [Bryobacteraceae bacterium]